MMKHRVLVMVLVLMTGGVALVWAGEPTEKIRATTDKILAVLRAPALKGAAKERERRTLIRKAVDERFDWDEMARRSLARHWEGRTEEEKKEFVPLYADLVDRAYMSKVEGYSGEKVRYEGEAVDGNYATVTVRIATQKGQDIAVEYRLRKKGNDWLIYDVSIEGVSLVNNYRTQFNSIISQSSYASLIKQLKAKVASN
jgi:phospholipid transport system substrate-binding protein